MAEFICGSCGKKYPLDTGKWRCDCTEPLTLQFKPKAFDTACIDKSEWSMWRYRAFFPLENELWRDISLGEGMTPIVKLSDGVLVKLDYAMPTLSFKDRGAALLIWLCKTIGVQKVIQDSSGNAGNSIAAYAARAGISCEIFVPKGTSAKKIDMIRSHGAHVTVFDGTRDETAAACREKADLEGIYYASHVYNSMFYQGTKTYIYEVFEQLGRLPSNLFVPVGNGTLLLGITTALSELAAAGAITHMPKIFAVQSANCAPLLTAFEAGAAKVSKITPYATLAEGIAIGEPMRGNEILGLASKYNITFVSCRESDILPARQALAGQGLYVEHTTAATYAAFLSYSKAHHMCGDTLIPLCGAGLKSDK